MAVLFFDRYMEDHFPEECQRLWDSIKIEDIKYLELGIKLIRFDSQKFGDKEPVLALMNNKGEIRLTNIEYRSYYNM